MSSETTVVRVALVVGVNDYSSVDASGRADLRGARNDAISWAVAARSLGIAEIHLLTSPPLTASDLPMDASGVVFGEATTAAIRAGVQSLATALGAAGVGQGLVAYSGHGAEDARGLLLCPSDVGADLGNAISYAEVAAALGTHAPRTNVTFFLDTCHAAPKPTGLRMLHNQGRRSLVHEGTLSVSGASGQTRGLRDTDLVLAACRTSETSAEAFLQHGVHGAFTWAATAALSRGGLARDEETGLSCFGVSYKQLLQRIHSLLQSMGFSQRPVLEGPVVLADLPVLHARTLSPVAPAGGAEDDGSIRIKELFPEEGEGGSPMNFALYEIASLSGGQFYGYVLVTGSEAVSFQGFTWAANQDYWMWQSGWAWTTEGFRLSVVPSATLPPGTLNPAGSIPFQSQKFPPLSASESLSVNQTNGIWWSISFTQTNLQGQIGWLKLHPGQQSNWYEYTDVTWWSGGGESVQPMRWFTIVPPGAGGTYQNHYLYFHYALGGPSATTDTHPGDQASPNAGQYVLSHIVKIVCDQVAP